MVGSNQQPLNLSGGTLPLHARSSASEWHRWQQRKTGEAIAVVRSSAETSGFRSEKMARLEATFFVADGPLSTRKLCQFALLADTSEVKELIDELNRTYDEEGSAFGIERVASGYQMLTRPRFAHWLDQLHQRTAELKLSSPAMETLTIVAYRQPITRADIEAIRGVQCSEILKLLMERGLVKIGGEDDSLGRPYLYITTRMFLELFGLRTLDDLPSAAELRLRPKSSLSSQDEEETEELEDDELDEDSEEEWEEWEEDDEEDEDWGEEDDDDQESAA